jgi:hypothetical protein
LLCTDYFNHFNEVIMLLNMLPDAPEMLDDVDQWGYMTYREHFEASGLHWAPLAIECYEAAPAQTRDRFEKLTTEMSMLIVETRIRLRHILEEGNRAQFADMALLHSMQLQGMVDDGGAIVHGYQAALDQSSIDQMF